MDGLLQSVPLSPVPLDQIIGRGKGIRLRRAGAAAGGLGLAGMIAAAIVLVLRMLQAPAFPVTIAASALSRPVGSSPAAPRTAMRGGSPSRTSLIRASTACLRSQLPANVDRIILDGRETLPAVQVTACGKHYRLVSFAYPLNRTLAVTVPGNQPACGGTWDRPETSPHRPSLARGRSPVMAGSYG